MIVHTFIYSTLDPGTTSLDSIIEKTKTLWKYEQYKEWILWWNLLFYGSFPTSQFRKQKQYWNGHLEHILHSFCLKWKKTKNWNARKCIFFMRVFTSREYNRRAQQILRCVVNFFSAFSIVTCILLIDSNDVYKSSACCEESWPFRCTHISANQKQKQTTYCEYNSSEESSSQKRAEEVY